MSRIVLVLVAAACLAAPASAQNSLSGVPPDDSQSQPSDDNSVRGFGNASGDTHGLAGEGIANFDTDDTIGVDGTVTVRETLTVNVTGASIRHGIFRDFPTDYQDRHGFDVHVRFDVQSVTMDGHEEKYELDSISNGMEVKIGDPDVIVDHGLHTYVIVYQTNRQVGFFKDYDELYWNATGNGWPFTIAHAVATVHLPPGASVIQSSVYTGEQGEDGHDATATKIDNHTMRFETTRQLADHEGMTFAVGFTKGIIKPPTASEETENFLLDNAAIATALIGFVALVLYFGIVWWKFGRDPRHGTIVPLFAPPKNFSPSAVRYVHRMGYDRKAYAAALINMAVKGYLKIAEDGSSYSLTRTGKSEDECGLALPERMIAKALFDGPTDSITLKQSNHTDVQASIAALQSALRNEDEGVYFVTNRGWFLGGIVILAISALGAALLSRSAGSFPILFWLTGWSVGTSFLVHRVYLNWAGVSGPGFKALHIMGALFSTFLALIFVGALLIAMFALPSQGISPVTMLALALQGVLAFVFYRLLKAPTVAGQKVRDEIDGFRMFLDVAEKDRLEKLNPPQVTPEVFEKFLPYAIALDCENQWSKKFEAEAAAAGIATGQGGYVPVWYVGNSFSRLGTSGFVSSVGTAIGSAAASAAVAPGSSSGSGGGGFSGGGGGGGGGGGW